MKRRLKFSIIAALAVMLVAVVSLGIFVATHFNQDWFRREIISQVEGRTGARVEMKSFAFDIWRLQFGISGLTVHGLETADSPPLFQADRVDLDLRIVSLLHRQIALDSLVVERPQVFVRIESDGRSNVPKPKRAASNRPWRDTLFSLRVGRLELRDGSASFNNRRVPLDLRGQNLAFDLRYAPGDTASDAYVGNLQWRQVRLADKRNTPFLFDVSTRFTLRRNSFDLDDLVLKLPHSEFDLRAE